MALYDFKPSKVRRFVKTLGKEKVIAALNKDDLMAALSKKDHLSALSEKDMIAALGGKERLLKSLQASLKSQQHQKFLAQNRQNGTSKKNNTKSSSI